MILTINATMLKSPSTECNWIILNNPTKNIKSLNFAMIYIHVWILTVQ